MPNLRTRELKTTSRCALLSRSHRVHARQAGAGHPSGIVLVEGARPPRRKSQCRPGNGRSRPHCCRSEFTRGTRLTAHPSRVTAFSHEALLSGSGRRCRAGYTGNCCPSGRHLAALTFDQLFNLGEGLLWLAIGLVIGIRTLRSKDGKRIGCGAAVSFALFGVSDFIEMRTGAWYSPWSLLALKAACVVSLLAHFIAYRKRQGRKATSDMPAEH